MPRYCSTQWQDATCHHQILGRCFHWSCSWSHLQVTIIVFSFFQFIYIFFWCYKLFVGICSYLIEQLAKDGFLIISVPFNVTFDHANAAKQVYKRFNSCLDSILISGLPHANLTPQQLVNLPLFSVGHRFVNFIIFFLYYITLLLLTAYSNNKLII